MRDTRVLAEQPRGFPETHWGLVEAPTAGEDARRGKMERIALLYWRPVYLYIRRRWRLQNEEAKDLTQTFFLKLLESGAIERADPERGRFRTFLRTCLENMLRNDYQAAHAQKRGGGRAAVPLDAVEEASCARLEASEAERAIDAERSREALHGALARLREVLWFEGKAVQFQVFVEHEMPAGDRAPSYQELAEKYGVPVTSITNYLHRVRMRLRDVLMEMQQEFRGANAD